MNKDIYPTKKELKRIREWDTIKNPLGLIEFIKELWMYSNSDYFALKGKRVIKLELHTGGWSGNEDIIAALRKNEMFFFLYWQKSTRGGHHYFRIEKIK